jgi:hypothetical protein
MAFLYTLLPKNIFEIVLLRNFTYHGIYSSFSCYSPCLFVPYAKRNFKNRFSKFFGIPLSAHVSKPNNDRPTGDWSGLSPADLDHMPRRRQPRQNVISLMTREKRKQFRPRSKILVINYETKKQQQTIKLKTLQLVNSPALSLPSPPRCKSPKQLLNLFLCSIRSTF